jgi:hypothetical protein
MTFVDTNVLIDILQDDPTWAPWSAARLYEAVEAGPATINAIVIAELSRSYATTADLLRHVDALMLTCTPIDEETAFQAGRRFAGYRQRRPEGQTCRVLPDFFVGAHALTRGEPLLTRDVALYRTCFPELTLITPEDDHG